MDSKAFYWWLSSWVEQASSSEEQLYTFTGTGSQRSGCRRGLLRSEEWLAGCVGVGLEGRLSLWSSTSSPPWHGAKSRDSSLLEIATL